MPEADRILILDHQNHLHDDDEKRKKQTNKDKVN